MFVFPKASSFVKQSDLLWLWNNLDLVINLKKENIIPVEEEANLGQKEI